MVYPDELAPWPLGFDPKGGLGFPVPEAARIAKPVLTKPYMAAGNTYNATQVPLALPTTIDDAMRERGVRHYEWMMTDPIVSSSVQVLKLAILAGGLDLKTPVSPKPGTKELNPDETLGEEVVKFCWRCVERCKGWNAFLTDILSAAAFGNKLAEKVFEVAATGEDAGKLVWGSIKVKPRDAWQFIVDLSMNVLGVRFRRAGGLWEYLPREKVVIFTWDASDADPRGTSVLRPAVEACNMKRLMWPQLYKHASQFGSASLVGKTAPGEVDRHPVDARGMPIPGAPPVSPQEFMAGQLVAFQNGSVLVVPAGAEVAPIQPQGDGSAFHRAVDLFNREIVQAILLQTRATMEATHGSKADSQTGQDMFGLLVDAGRTMLAQTLRDDCFRQLVALNYGDDAADRFTPLVTFGTQDVDRASQWSAVASLMGSKYLGDSQLEELDAMMGLPIRDMQADKAQAAANAAAAGLPQPGNAPPPQDGNQPPPDGPPPPEQSGSPSTPE
jgi:hypothetical protein